MHQHAAPEEKAVIAPVSRGGHDVDHVVAKLDALRGVAGDGRDRGCNDDTFAERHIVLGLPLLIAVATHDDDVDVFEEVIEGQLVPGVERGAGHRNDPVVAPVMVGDISVETHGQTNTDDPRWLVHAATVVGDTDDWGQRLCQNALSCRGVRTGKPGVRPSQMRSNGAKGQLGGKASLGSRKGEGQEVDLRDAPGQAGVRAHNADERTLAVSRRARVASRCWVRPPGHPTVRSAPWGRLDSPRHPHLEWRRRPFPPVP